MNPSAKAFIAFMVALTVNASSGYAQDASGLLLPPATYSKSDVAERNSPAVGTPIDDLDGDNEVFQDALNGVSPLTPDQIRQTRQKIEDVDRASNGPIQPVQPVTRSVALSLKSGERPAVVKVSPGWISTLTFSDVTGQPWPVLSVTNGNPTAYHVQSSGPQDATNIITISARQGHIASNIAITLVGAKVPILMSLDPTTSEVDFRVDAQVDERGPNASFDIMTTDSLAATNDSVMLSFLDGVPPNNAKKLKTSSRGVQAWRYEDMIYVRTSNSVLSPAHVSKSSNASGVNVYVMKEAPVLLVSNSGQTDYVHINR